MMNIGICSGFVVGWLCSEREGWTLLMMTAASFAGVFLVLQPCLPESPRWMAACGRDDEAQAVLASVMSNSDALSEWQQIQRRREHEDDGIARTVSARAWFV